MADARYKDGVFQGNGFQHKRKPTLTNNPLLFGWQKSHWHEQYDLLVYWKGSLKMMHHPTLEGWIVEDAQTGQQHYHNVDDLEIVMANIEAKN